MQGKGRGKIKVIYSMPLWEMGDRKKPKTQCIWHDVDINKLRTQIRTT